MTKTHDGLLKRLAKWLNEPGPVWRWQAARGVGPVRTRLAEIAVGLVAFTLLSLTVVMLLAA